MKAALRVVAFALVACVLTMAGATQALAGRYASIVVDSQTGKVLYSRNADERLYPASLTKMMTLYMVFEALEKKQLSLSTPIKASTRAVGMPPSKLGLKAGETITVEEAIKVLVTKSANDVAVMVAEALAGSEVQFAAKMTKKANDLGMKRTTFRNASGLPNTAQLSTAEDMATLAMALHKHFPKYYHYFNTRSVTVKGKTFNTHNRVLLNYKGADGLKTGFINASGFNLVTSAVRDGRRLVGVVFGGESAGWRDAHMIKLLDQAYAGKHDAPAKGKAAPVMVTAPAPKATALAAAPLPVAKPALGAAVQPVSMAAAVPAPVPPPAPVPAPPAVAAPATVAMALTPPAAMTLAAPAVSPPAALGGGENSAAIDPGARGPATVGRDGWGVQVGAFSRFEAAQMKAVEAADRLKRNIQSGHPKIITVRDEGSTIYRARVMGMTERDARSACDSLKRASMACIVVPPDVNLALARGTASTTATD